MKKLVVLIALTAIGCTPEPNQTMDVPLQSDGRFKVTRVAVFDDKLAYNARRGIYTIVDTKTKREFVGVSGVGISEIGSHAAGKQRLSDER